MRAKSLLTVLILIPLLLVSSAPRLPVLAAENLQKIEREMQQRRSQLQNLNKEYTEKARKLKDVQKKVEKTTKQLLTLERDIDVKEAELGRLENELRDAEARLEEAQRHLEETERQLERRTDLLSRRVRALYEHGSVSYLDVLVSANDFADFLTRFEHLQMIVESDINLFNEVKRLRAQAIQLKQQREQERIAVMVSRDKVQEMKDYLEAKKAETEDLRKRFLNDEAAIRQALDELEQQSARITAELKRLEAKYEEELKRQGAIVLTAPVNAGITSGFGMRFHPIARQNRMHTGVDYGAAYGTPVKAAESGKVVSAGWLGGYGKAVIIYHGSKVSTLYGHMSSLAVSDGQMVQKGQVIGYVGSTGFSTGPHLHFEVRIDGEPKDPLAYLNVPIK